MTSGERDTALVVVEAVKVSDEPELPSAQRIPMPLAPAVAVKVSALQAVLGPSMVGGSGITQLNVPGAPDMSVNDARVVARV
jgi:hypothetical protein